MSILLLFVTLFCFVKYGGSARCFHLECFDDVVVDFFLYNDFVHLIKFVFSDEAVLNRS